MKFSILIAVLLLSVASVMAQEVVINDSCYSGGQIIIGISFDEFSNVSSGVGPVLVSNECAGTNVVLSNVTLVLGPITDGEVIITDTSVYVDSFARPDLDVPSQITFSNIPFVMEPTVKRDGVVCGDCNSTFDEDARTLIVQVPGFSNYSLSGIRDFVVQSDPEPELKSKVYQTIDLGDARRSSEFKCIVQLYGRNEGGQWILTQTNPERKIAATIFGNPDSNNPESLGYFKTENGLANVYFDGTKLTGYQDLEYVVQCADNSTKLVYEESVSTRFKPAGREVVARGVWLTSGDNAFYTSLIWVGAFFGIIFILLVIRMWRNVARGR